MGKYMDDMNVVRSNVGTVASFKKWDNIKQDGNVRDLKEIEKEKEKPKFDFKELPGRTIENVSKQELKNIAIKLLPTIDKISKEDYIKVANDAIEFAFEFERVFAEKISEE